MMLRRVTTVCGRGSQSFSCSVLSRISSVSFSTRTDGGAELGEESKSKSPLLHSLHNLTDEQVVSLVKEGKVSQYKLESELKHAIELGNHPNCERAVRIRRLWLRDSIKEQTRKADYTPSEVSPLETDEIASSKGLPYTVFDYNNFYQEVLGKNCENVIGYIPIPVGFVGPLKLNEREYHIPLATTEGALLASTNRGCRAITESGGAMTHVFNNGMTRAPVLKFESARAAGKMKKWIEVEENFVKIKAAFESTTRFGKLVRVTTSLAGRHLFLRFVCETGDAMGMNMVTKGSLHALEALSDEFDFEVLALSGNVCTDKKPSAINWLEGRGKSVVAEVTLTDEVITKVLKCTIKSLAELNISKNLVGSAIAGSIGGNNAHASNIVTALFLATGQDPAQNVESSNCMTLMEPSADSNTLHVSVTMPVIEVGTIGGGTGLPAQWACLELLGVAGSNRENPGKNSEELASIVAGTVLAGEISLMSALAANHLVSAHMKLNR